MQQYREDNEGIRNGPVWNLTVTVVVGEGMRENQELQVFQQHKKNRRIFLHCRGQLIWTVHDLVHLLLVETHNTKPNQQITSSHHPVRHTLTQCLFGCLTAKEPKRKRNKCDKDQPILFAEQR